MKLFAPCLLAPTARSTGNKFKATGRPILQAALAVQVKQLKQALKGEQLTRELVTQELRKSLAHQKRSQRRLAEREAEAEKLQAQVQELAQHAALAHSDLQDKEAVVQARVLQQCRLVFGLQHILEAVCLPSKGFWPCKVVTHGAQACPIHCGFHSCPGLGTAR